MLLYFQTSRLIFYFPILDVDVDGPESPNRAVFIHTDILKI